MELFTRFTFVSPAGTISDAGIRELIALIQTQNRRSDVWTAIDPTPSRYYLPALPDTWEWVWVIERGEYAGTMPKRVRNYYYKAHGIRCPNVFIEQIGNIARAHSSESVVYHFEFVNRFDWYAGEFGDGGSCYWGSNESALDMLVENGALAVCFFNAAGNGVGRAWMFQIGESLYILWNGYGFQHATMTIARVVAAHLNLTYKQISLSNNGETTGTLWINSGVGFVIGAVEVVESINYHDLGWYDANATTCENCGYPIHVDDVYAGADGGSYCADCYYQYFDSCYHCGETYTHENITRVADEAVCDYCLRRLYVVCDRCGEYVHKSHAIDHKKGTYCQHCTPSGDA